MYKFQIPNSKFQKGNSKKVGWEMEVGRWEMEVGRWEMGDGRWEQGVYSLSLSLSLSHSVFYILLPGEFVRGKWNADFSRFASQNADFFRF
ncbi:MAG: hypothetical protein ACK4FS_06350 [Flavobacterium sp.]